MAGFEEMKIRLASQKDARNLAKISAKVFRTKEEDELAVLQRGFRSLIKQASFVVEDKGEVIAFIIFEKQHDFYGKTAFMTSLLVKKEYRHHGIGKMLCEKSLKEIKKLGFKTASTFVDEKNTIAQSLYRKMGFKRFHFLILKKF